MSYQKHRQGEIMKRLLLFATVIVLSFSTGCAHHYTINSTNKISNKLDINELYNIYNVNSVDLSAHSKCEASPTIRIVNVESRTEDYEICKDGPSITYLINPKEMMDSAVLYLKNGFKQSHIKVDDQSTKVLQLKMIDMKLDAGFSFGSYFKIELIIPETGFTKFYEARDNSMDGLLAAAYPIHTVTRQIIDDPAIQDYILCRTKYKEPLKRQEEGSVTSESLSQKLQELQTALDNGLITKEECQLKRKTILEKY